jgi:Damage-control phosphatase ARMT1-like domain
MERSDPSKHELLLRELL